MLCVGTWRRIRERIVFVIPDPGRCDSRREHTGRPILDDYRFRSAYAPALTTNFFSARDAVDAPGKVDWIVRMEDEYLSIRRLLSSNFYPLTKPSATKDVWCAMQYHDHESAEGIVLVF